MNSFIKIIWVFGYFVLSQLAFFFTFTRPLTFKTDKTEKRFITELHMFMVFQTDFSPASSQLFKI